MGVADYTKVSGCKGITGKPMRYVSEEQKPRGDREDDVEHCELAR